jgi:hypothetical protein
MGTGLVVAAALSVGAAGVAGVSGCASKAQRAEQQQQKQAIAAEKAEQKRVAAQRKQDQKLAEEQAKRDKQLAAEQAKRDKQLAADQAKRDKQLAAEQRKQDQKTREQEARDEKRYKDKWGHEDGIGSDIIRPDNETRLVDRWSRAQAASGARQDLMLYSDHFDNNQLNSLGRSKLALILDGHEADLPVTIYVSGPQNAAQARIAAVDSYIKDAYAGQQFQLKEGFNYDLTTPALYNLGALQKLNKPTGAQNATAGGGDTTGGRSRINSSSSGSSSQ